MRQFRGKALLLACGLGAGSLSAPAALAFGNPPFIDGERNGLSGDVPDGLSAAAGTLLAGLADPERADNPWTADLTAPQTPTNRSPLLGGPDSFDPAGIFFYRPITWAGDVLDHPLPPPTPEPLPGNAPLLLGLAVWLLTGRKRRGPD